MKPITLAQARKVLKIVDAGLVYGLGRPIPGQMCVEAAVCFALGQTHGDEPECVHAAVRLFKIRLNDSKWSSDQARAKGMRRIAVAQLGSKDSLVVDIFKATLQEQTIRKIVPIALRAAASMKGNSKWKERLKTAALKCESEGTIESAKEAKKTTTADAYAAAAAAAADAADAYAAAADAAYAAYAAADADKALKRDEILTLCAEIGIEALRAAGSPGVVLMDQLCPL